MNLIHLAIRENDLLLLMEQLKLHDSDKRTHYEINALENTTGYTPLQLAIFLCRFDMAVLLLVHGANPNMRADDTHHVFQQIMTQRNGGDLLAPLLFMAPGIQNQFKEHFRGQINFNATVFHVLFYTALTLNKDDFALKLLKETLPTLPANLRDQLIETFTGALYYCAKNNKRQIAELLVNLQTPTVDPRLPNLGVELLPWTRSQTETKLSFADAVNTNNYLEMNKSQNIEVDLPFDGNREWKSLKEAV